MRCPECFSEAIVEVEYEELHETETVNVCQNCGCRFWDEKRIQAHGNTKAGRAMFIVEMMLGNCLSISWLNDRLNEYREMR